MSSDFSAAHDDDDAVHFQIHLLAGDCYDTASLRDGLHLNVKSGSGVSFFSSLDN